MASANLLEHARLTYHKNDHFQLSSQSPSSLWSAYILIGPQLKLYPCACWGLCTKDQPPFHISISCQENSYMMCLWPEYLFHFLPILLRDSRKRRRFDSQSFTVFTSLVSGLSNLTKSIPQPFPPLPSNFDKPQVAENLTRYHSTLYIFQDEGFCARHQIVGRANQLTILNASTSITKQNVQNMHGGTRLFWAVTHVNMSLCKG